MTWIATGLMVASTVVGVAGSVKQSKAQKKAGRTQAIADLQSSRASAQLELEDSQAQAKAEREAGLAAYELGLLDEATAEFEAKQIMYNASQERATAQRTAREETRLGRVKQSRAVALAASSGATATDVSIVNLLGDIEGYAEYDSLTALYEGGERARTMETSAIIRRFEGAKARRAGEVTLDGANKRYAEILASGKRRAKAIVESGVSSASFARAAGNANASATIWSGIASGLGNAAGIADRYGKPFKETTA